MKYLLKLSLICLLFSCQNDKSSSYKLDENQYQKFEINCNSDTLLLSKGGVKINIDANTFDCTKNNKILLGFAEILDQIDMIQNEMYTIDENVKILESAGMFHLMVYSENDNIIKKSIQLEIPTLSSNPDMNVFLPGKNGNYFAWIDSNEKVEILNNESIASGDSLYSRYCTSCHSKNMRQNMTGPALGNVHLHRDLDWLTKFTRYSQQLIASGDSLAYCTYSKYSKVLMTIFPSLSDQEIKDIYLYIRNESLLQGLSEEEMVENYKCDSTFSLEADIKRSMIRNTGHLNTFEVLNNLIYTLNFDQLNWVNVDAFLNAPNMNQIESITTSVEGEYSELHMVMFFANRKIAIPFIKKNEILYELLNAFGKEKIYMPIGETYYIVAYNNDPKNFEFLVNSYVVKETNNHFNLKFDKSGEDEFKKLLAELKTKLNID